VLEVDAVEVLLRDVELVTVEVPAEVELRIRSTNRRSGRRSAGRSAGSSSFKQALTVEA
jgi:hypothetical protein